ncbi:MAG: signal transduction histidine kinase, partial [Actinobacteria bacterium]|nr:signal transduction histidine kinase [Actinomycetota bacterium]
MRVGLRTAAVVLAATALPIVSLLWASGVAKSEVRNRALGGMAAIGKATSLQEQQAWDDAIRIVASAAGGSGLLTRLESHNPELAREVASQSARNILMAGPFGDVRMYDAAGNLLAMASLPGVNPTAVTGTHLPSITLGDTITNGTQSSRQVAVSIGGVRGPEVGRLVVDVDVTQLLGKPEDLAFGQTGEKFLVTPAGMVVAGSEDNGGPLLSPTNLAIVAAGKSVTTLIYSPFYRRLTIESYEPIPGQNLGILVQQARSEVMGGADRLAARLRWVAFTFGMLGIALAAALGTFLSRRSRRLAASERQLAGSQVEARQRLEQFLDAMPIGVFVATPDGHPHYANREAQRLLGRGVVPGAAPDDLAEVYQAYVAGTSKLYPTADMPLVRALTGETSHADDMELRTPNATVPVEVWGTPVLAGDDSIEFSITAFADVSERRRAAEEVQFLSAITANMSEGVVVVREQDGTIAYGNSSLDAMFGYEPGGLIGRPVHNMNAPGAASPEETASAIIEALQTNGAWRGEVHNIRKDGTPFWCAVNVTAHDLPTFGPVWISVLSDITGRRQAQEAQARLASIVQASREAILGKTLDGIVTSWNPGAQVLFGYTAAEMIGASIEVLIAPERRDEETALRGRVARGLGVEQYETVRLRKDGSSVDVSVTLSLIEDTEGRIPGIATICQDISERKRARAALLEREDQLAAARDEALEASRLKSQFLANMSHEIRTPMNGVLGMAQLLLNGNLEPGQRRRVLALRESGQSLLTIINDILDFSKMEAGKLELEEVDFNLLAAAESVVSLLSSPANDKGLSLTLNVARGVPGWVRGDSVRLRQVLINLLGNAVKFTERGGVEFTIGQAASGDLRFAVRDTGIGIDPSSKERLLEPFTQADASTTRRFGGTGLGLAICRQLVELMGSSLKFTSEPGAGTTFWFEVALPAVEVGDGEGAPRGTRPAGDHVADRAAPSLGGGARILLVDDAEINREVGKGLLESLGYRVEMASSGSEAVEAVRHSPYAAIVMDCLMPDMDG